MADPRAITLGILSMVQKSRFLGREVHAMTLTPDGSVDESTVKIPVKTIVGSGMIQIVCPDLNTVIISARLGLTKRQGTFELSIDEKRFKERDPWPDRILDEIKRWLEKR